MPTFTADFSDVPDREAIPAGEYVLEIVAVELKVSKGEKTSGSQMLGMHWKVLEGEFSNSRIFDNLLLAGNAMWKTKQAFAAMFGKKQQQFEMSTDEMAGTRVRARVIQDVWSEEDDGDGETRNRIAKYMPLTTGAPGEASVDDLFR